MLWQRGICIRIEEIKDSDLDQAVFFYNNIHREKRTSKQLIWEYKGNYPKSFVFTIIKDDGRIVGTQGMIPIYVNIKGKKYLSGKSESSLLDSKYRGGELFKELYDFAISLCKTRNMCVIWGITHAIKVWKNKLGFSVYTDAIYTSILILKPQVFLSKILESKWRLPKKILVSFLILPLNLYSSVRMNTHAPFSGNSGEFSIEEKLRSIDDLRELYRRLRANVDIIHIEQDDKYIAWRVFNNPNIKYKTCYLYENNRLRAYCYLNINNEKNAYLTDFTFEDYEAGEILLKRVLNQLRLEDVTYVMFLGNIKNPLMARVFDLLERYGFIKRRDSEAFVILSMSNDHKMYLNDIRNWYVNGLWTEGYSW